MARISTYPVDKNITGTDILLGTDATGGTNATKNFLISDLSLIVVNDYLYTNSWKFTDNLDGLAESTKAAIWFPTDGGNLTPWSNITTLRLQVLMGNNTISKPYLEFLLTGNPTGGGVGNALITIADRKNLGSFGVFNFTAITAVAGKTDIYDITLGFVKGSGTIKDGSFYGIEIDAQGSSDKTFEFDQPTPAAVWNITHNLGKFPSITVIDSGDTVVTGQYTYTNNNNVVLNFSAAFAGKAYLN